MTSLPHGGIGQMPCQTSSRIFDKALATAEIARYNSVEQRSYEENLKVYRALINVVRTTERKGLAKDMAELVILRKRQDRLRFGGISYHHLNMQDTECTCAGLFQEIFQRNC